MAKPKRDEALREIYRRLKERLALNTQKDIAGWIGTSEGNLANWIGRPTDISRRTIAARLGDHPDKEYIMTGTPAHGMNLDLLNELQEQPAMMLCRVFNVAAGKLEELAGDEAAQILYISRVLAEALR